MALALLYEVEPKLDKNGNPRGYMIDGEKVPGVTTVLGMIDKPALKSWAWRIAVAGSAELPPMERTEKEQEAALVSAGHGWWQQRNKAAMRGTDVHRALQHLLAEGEPPDLDEWPEEQHGYVQALAKYWIEQQPKALAVEQPVGSRKGMYGGRIDLVRGEGKALTPLPVDFKTAKPDEFGKPREPFIEAHLQIAGYEEALSEQLGTLVARGEIVAICETGEYAIYPGVANPGKFPLLMAAFRFIREVEDAQKKWRKEHGDSREGSEED